MALHHLKPRTSGGAIQATKCKYLSVHDNDNHCVGLVSFPWITILLYTKPIQKKWLAITELCSNRTQRNHTGGLNAPGFGSTVLNKAAVIRATKKGMWSSFLVSAVCLGWCENSDCSQTRMKTTQTTVCSMNMIWPGSDPITANIVQILQCCALLSSSLFLWLLVCYYYCYHDVKQHIVHQTLP